MPTYPRAAFVSAEELFYRFGQRIYGVKWHKMHQQLLEPQQFLPQIPKYLKLSAERRIRLEKQSPYY